MMRQLKIRIKRLLDNNEITDIRERDKLDYLIRSKKWNPYCIRHSSITNDSDYLPEYALKKKVRWSMNSRQGTRYIKTRLGNELKEKILQYNGVVTDNEAKKKQAILICPRCEFVNVIENKYCSKCSYPIKPEAYEEIKIAEDKKLKLLEEKYAKEIQLVRQEMKDKFQQILERIDISTLSSIN